MEIFHFFFFFYFNKSHFTNYLAGIWQSFQGQPALFHNICGVWQKQQAELWLTVPVNFPIAWLPVLQ